MKIKTKTTSTEIIDNEIIFTVDFPITQQLIDDLFETIRNTEMIIYISDKAHQKLIHTLKENEETFSFYRRHIGSL